MLAASLFSSVLFASVLRFQFLSAASVFSLVLLSTRHLTLRNFLFRNPRSSGFDFLQRRKKMTAQEQALWPSIPIPIPSPLQGICLY